MASQEQFRQSTQTRSPRCRPTTATPTANSKRGLCRKKPTIITLAIILTTIATLPIPTFATTDSHRLAVQQERDGIMHDNVQIKAANAIYTQNKHDEQGPAKLLVFQADAADKVEKRGYKKDENSRGKKQKQNKKQKQQDRYQVQVDQDNQDTLLAEPQHDLAQSSFGLNAVDPAALAAVAAAASAGSSPGGVGHSPLPAGLKFPKDISLEIIQDIVKEFHKNETRTDILSLLPQSFEPEKSIFSFLYRTNKYVDPKKPELSCAFPGTPLKESDSRSGLVWECEAGNFCLAPNVTVPCPPGYYCPANTAQPILCCGGFYCSVDTKSIEICPEGFFCPMASTRPLPCNYLAYCPIGTDSVEKYGIGGLFFGFAIVVLAIFAARKRAHRAQKARYLRRMRELDHQSQEKERMKAVKEASSVLAAIAKDEQRAYSGQSNTNRRGDVEGGRSINQNLNYLVQSSLSLAGGAVGASAAVIGGGVSTRSLVPLSKPERSFDIRFENLGLKLPTGVHIIRNISGRLITGRTCAVMGPSGAGKTTFLSILAGKVAKTTGSIKVNGVEQTLTLWKKLIGFVPQEDVMLSDLTVREILMHSAGMRQPTKLSHNEKRLKVLEVIQFLQLGHIMDSPIGDVESRGVSGGERKRVNIGMELVASPSILFLDEPTSGLDSATSLEVCKLLKQIAREQFITVAAVVHSPSPHAFNQFDDLLLLGAGGRVVYFGPREEAAEYFQSIGYPVPSDESPADYFISLAAGRVNRHPNYDQRTKRYRNLMSGAGTGASGSSASSSSSDSYEDEKRGYENDDSSSEASSDDDEDMETSFQNSRMSPTDIRTRELFNDWERYCRNRALALTLEKHAIRESETMMTVRLSNDEERVNLGSSGSGGGHSKAIADELDYLEEEHMSASAPPPFQIQSRAGTNPKCQSSTMALYNSSRPQSPVGNSKGGKSSGRLGKQKKHKKKRSGAGDLSQIINVDEDRNGSFDPLTGQVYGNDNIDSIDNSSVSKRQAKHASHQPSRLEYYRISFISWWADVTTWFKDVADESKDCWLSIRRKVTGETDSVRETPSFFKVFLLCFKRACLQNYRSQGEFLSDQALHLACGLCVSFATRDMTYIPRQPAEICAIAPVSVQWACALPIDNIQFVAMFVSLGVLFAGISAGAATFGDEKAVFWRDTSAGMPTLPYYIAKVLADIPRVVVAAGMYTGAFIYFFAYQQPLLHLYLVILLLYFNAFSLGYFVSATVSRPMVGLVGTGMALSWALVFSGTAPHLYSVMNNPGYANVRWLWTLSAPRWSVEAFYLQEMLSRDYLELHHNSLPDTYDFAHYSGTILMILYIGLGWNVVSFMLMKLLDRHKAK